LLSSPWSLTEVRVLYWHGDGKRLVEECTRFARSAGYKRITLWTNSVLLAVRRLYEDAGFRLTGKESNHLFGQDLVSKTWDVEL
jgi:GNAT superfamily N-acetyltransferase